MEAKLSITSSPSSLPSNNPLSNPSTNSSETITLAAQEVLKEKRKIEEISNPREINLLASKQIKLEIPSKGLDKSLHLYKLYIKYLISIKKEGPITPQHCIDAYLAINEKSNPPSFSIQDIIRAFSEVYPTEKNLEKKKLIRFIVSQLIDQPFVD